MTSETLEFKLKLFKELRRRFDPMGFDVFWKEIGGGIDITIRTRWTKKTIVKFIAVYNRQVDSIIRDIDARIGLCRMADAARATVKGKNNE